MAKRNPHLFGANYQSPGAKLTQLELIKKALPIIILIFLVLGGMYIGFFTATEAGATGTTAAFAISLWRRTLTWKILWKLMVDTGHVTASLILIIISANMFSRFLALSGLPDQLEQWVSVGQYSLYPILGLYLLVVLFLGTAMDSASTTLIAVPIFTVIFKALGADLIWIGIITMITVEIGLLTPPLGIAPFVIKMTLDDKSITLNDIYAGALPFAFAAFVVVLLIIAFPWLATGLIR
jgi:tripartite ATP-independent transporter DctM subunit